MNAHVLLNLLNELRKRDQMGGFVATTFGVDLHLILQRRDRSDSVVECLTRDRGAAGSSLTGATTLWSLSKTHLS